MQAARAKQTRRAHRNSSSRLERELPATQQADTTNDGTDDSQSGDFVPGQLPCFADKTGRRLAPSPVCARMTQTKENTLVAGLELAVPTVGPSIRLAVGQDGGKNISILQGVNMIAMTPTDDFVPNLDLAGGSLSNVGSVEIGPWLLQEGGDNRGEATEERRVLLPDAPRDASASHRLLLGAASPSGTYALHWERESGVALPAPPEDDGTYMLRVHNGNLTWVEER